MSNPIKINKDNLGASKSQLIFPQQVTMRMVNPVNGGSVPTTLVLAPIQKSSSHIGGSITTQILPKTEVSPIIAAPVKTQTQVIEEIETHSPPMPSALSGGETSLYDLREKAVAIKSCMSLTMDEVEKLILGDMVVKGTSQLIFTKFLPETMIFGHYLLVILLRLEKCPTERNQTSPSSIHVNFVFFSIMIQMAKLN